MAFGDMAGLMTFGVIQLKKTLACIPIKVYTYLSMWAVFQKKTVDKALSRAPRDVLVRYEAWKRTVELLGPQGLKKVRGFRDEALRGGWKGYRSSRLGKQWRVIYQVEGDSFGVYVVEINPHKY